VAKREDFAERGASNREPDLVAKREDFVMGPVRLAGPEDAGVLASLVGTFRDWYGEDAPGDARILRSVERLLDDDGTEFLIAGEPPAAFAQLRFRHSLWTGADDAWLEDLYVDADARRAGLGRALVEACVERARERGCRRIQLDCNERNRAALALYESLGFSAAQPRRWQGGRDLNLTCWL
jgi:GNAT superfamily N-acetyltransferase